jgi:large subunit ribosomal protein L22
MKAIARQLRITPRKINLIAQLIRNKEVNDALSILQFTPKKGAKLLYKILKSAVANAENNFKQERDSLYVKEIIVGKAMTLKRSVPISRGRMHPILKRSAHVIVSVGVKEGKPETTPAKNDKKKETVKETKKVAQKAAPAEKAVKAAPAKKPHKVTKVKA